MDIAIDVGTNGNILTWVVVNEFPHWYRICYDEYTLTSLNWNGDPIAVNLDWLDVGSYRFNATVYDAAGNNASDSAYVNVFSSAFGGLGTELVMIASGLTVAIFIVVTLIFKKLS
ncbi:MAG: hypothetical protein ACFFEE_02345 [Candidatus Thorarchaeota archaeon]